MPPESESKDEDAARIVRKTFRAPGFIELYANASQGAFTPWDVQITFSKLGHLDGEQAIGELVTVYLSPQHAKAVVKVLESAIQGYEEHFGEIKLSAAQDPNASAAQKPSAKGKATA